MFDIQVNETTSSFKQTFVVGPTIFRPKYFNPTRAELNEFYGVEKEGEPVYIKEIETEDGKTYKRVQCSIYGFLDVLNGKTVRSVITFFIEERFYESRKSEETKYQFIDAYGNTAWAPSKETISSIYFYKDQCRKAYVNEEKLMKFFLKLSGLNTYYSSDPSFNVNLNFKEGKTFLNMEALFKGDFEPYKSVIKNMCTEDSIYKPNHPLYMRSIGVICSVRDNGVNKCQQIFFQNSFASVIKKGGKEVLNDFDVKFLLREVSIYDKNGVLREYPFAHSGGEITDKLVEYTPVFENADNNASDDFSSAEVTVNDDTEPFSL